MDLLLTHGYFLYEDPHELAVMKPYPPLGLLYISSHLKARGVPTALFDTTFSRPDDLDAYLRRERPRVVGLYCNLMTRTRVLDIMRTAREVGSVVVAGGPDPANYLDEYLSHGADVIVIGEGELTLEELVPHLLEHGVRDLSDIRGIAYRADGGQIVRTEPRPLIPDLNAQPFPDRAAIDQPEYVRIWRDHHGQGSVSLITARGCPFTCTWCSHAVFGYSHRRRSPTNVVDEVEQIVSEYKPDQLWYADDVFTINHKWLFEYAHELEQRGLRLPFETISREDRLNEQVVETLARMGCYRLWIGAESGSQRVLDAMKRRTQAARVREMVHLLQRYGIEVGMFIMLGYEGEGRSDIEATVSHLKEAGPNTFLTTVAYPIKNTPYYESVKERVVARREWEQGSDRDYTVAGRHSMRYYDFATRWMVSEVALHKQRRDVRLRTTPRLAKTFVSAQIGRIGMLLTEREREPALP
ncbi:MAG: B12-binding domain-containing radical SAM protein [Chloroflexi bacterium]|nr:B12-binding domain-containing radical SAM protein [Chloroflexota bacterium]